jgi:hypothetical protein
VLYTITFKSGAQQEFELDDAAVVQLVTGFRAVNEGGKPMNGILGKGDAALLLSEIAAFGPYIGMAAKYGSAPIPPPE